MRYWWVNQSATYKDELAGHFLWAPVRSVDGRRQPHWETMQDVQGGDVIVHYARGHVRAVSRAATSALDHRRPASLPPQKWQPAGRLIRTTYSTLIEPLNLSDIPEDMRRGEPAGGPFDRRAAVKQGYLFPISVGLGAWLEDHVGEGLSTPDALSGAIPTWPELAGSSYLPARELLQRLIGVELETPSGRRNLILSVTAEVTIVATDRARDGREVAISEVQDALDRLSLHGKVEITPESVGYRSAFIGAVLATLPGAYVEGSPPVVRVIPFTDGAPAATGNFEGDLERIRSTVTRGEQAALRRRLFGTAAVAECAICGGTYPVSFLVAAHIKRRALCNEQERRLLDRIAMAACVFGCDALFELGYVSVDGEGAVVCADVPPAMTAINTRLDQLQGRSCAAHSELSAPYFAWHLQNIFVRTP